MTISIYNEYSLFEKSIKNRFKQIEKSHMNSLSLSLYKMDIEQVKSVMEGIISDPDISFIEIRDGEQEYNFHIKLGEKEEDSYSFKKIKIMYVDSENAENQPLNIGTLSVQATQKNLNLKIKKQLTFFAIVQFFQLIFISLIIYGIFKHLVVKHLDKISSYVESLDHTDLSKPDLILERKSKQEKDEIDEVVVSINKMRKKVGASHKNMVDLNLNLNKLIGVATKEIQEEKFKLNDLLNNMKQAIFTFGKDFIISSPVSKYSEEIFEDNIVGKNIFELLYFNIRKGTKEHSSLKNAFDFAFEVDRFQFIGIEHSFPEKVFLPGKRKGKGISLKLSYGAIVDAKGLVKAIQCVGEDITELEDYHLDSSGEYFNFLFIKEISKIKNKKELAKKCKTSIQNVFSVLENFVSPLSDTYDKEYFQEHLITTFTDLKRTFFLENELSIILDELKWSMENLLDPSQKVDYQVESTNIVCDILDHLLKYQGSLALFINIDFSLNIKLLDTVLEKVEDIKTTFLNLFEYVFLVRKVESIDSEKLKKVVQVAKLYPEFERTIDLIQQRSRLIYFLLQGIGEVELSSVFGKMSFLVKMMPERRFLNESILENNLINPYKQFLDKTSNIQEELPKKFQKKVAA
ncbi:hypothetical protein OAK75_05400 [Bacteriovoracales bacterium]|nr:hypothetical protein [Bacteriovoracales bacterium]